MSKLRTYSELMQFRTFEERFEYLKLDGVVGAETFGIDRYINQQFYNRSKEWKQIRRDILIRDNGYDMGCETHPIMGKVIVHHMNPVYLQDIVEWTDLLTNPEYLISVSFDTHNAIHYASANYLEAKKMVIRTPNDTCPWNLQVL